MVNHPLDEGKIFLWIKERSSPQWGFLTAVSSLKHSKLIKAIVANKSTKGSQVHETKSKRCESNHRNALKTSPKWRPLFVRSRFIEIKTIQNLSKQKWFSTRLCQPLQRPMLLTEPGWNTSAVHGAVQGVKTRRCETKFV